MTKRQEHLLAWMERWGPFTSEHALRLTAERAESCSPDELEWLARQWRIRSSAGSEAADKPIGAGPADQPDDQEEPTMTDQEPPGTDLEPTVDVGELAVFTLDQRRAKAYSESGYWPDASSIAKALVKIEAGRSLELPAIIAMSEIHVIEGKPTLGAGALSTLVKRSGRYDYRVVELSDERCTLRFYDRGEGIGESVFTLEDAQRAGLAGPSWKKYPRNMLFARAMSNGVAWFAPDAIGGRFYTSEEFRIDEGDQPVEGEADEIPVEA